MLKAVVVLEKDKKINFKIHFRKINSVFQSDWFCDTERSYVNLEICYESSESAE